MKDIKEAIEKIKYVDKKFPEEAFQMISANREEAIPYLYEGIEKAISEGNDLDENYQLHFYALFLLGEFQDKNSFEKIMKMMMLPSEVLDYLIGDAITSGLSDILYNTYNGNLELLKSAILNIEVDDYVKDAILKVMGQLYLDKVLEKEEWQNFIRKAIHSEVCIGDYVYTSLALIICKCHMLNMLSEIRWLFERELIDEMMIGGYASYVDDMFLYKDCGDNLCEKPMNVAKWLKGWAMFEDDRKEESEELDFFENEISKTMSNNKTEKKVKIGRNDPCPCGSGRKYKHCCMNNLKNDANLIESEQEQKKWLKKYPAVEVEHKEGRIYIEDYYDMESIEIDKLLYLALKNRLCFLWDVNHDEDESRIRRYLWEAFIKFREKIDRERIITFDEYDEKYSIHYQCREWMEILLEALKEVNASKGYDEVKSIWDKMECTGVCE